MTLSDDRISALMERAAANTGTTVTFDGVIGAASDVKPSRKGSADWSGRFVAVFTVAAVIAALGLLATVVRRDNGPSLDTRPLAERLASESEPPGDTLPPWWNNAVEASPATRYTLDGKPVERKVLFVVGPVSDVVAITGTVDRDEPMIEGEPGAWNLTVPFNDQAADRAVIGLVLSVETGVAGDDQPVPDEVTIALHLPSPTDVPSLRSELIGQRFGAIVWPQSEQAWPAEIWAQYPQLYGVLDFFGTLDGDTITFGSQQATIAEMLAGAGTIAMETVDGGPTRVVDTTVPSSAPTTAPAPNPILRPYIDPTVCHDGVADGDATSLSTITAKPFAVSGEAPIPIQVFGEAADDPAAPFAVALRYTTTPSRRTDAEGTVINGVSVWIRSDENGNGEAIWNLPAGGWAYVRTRGYDTDDIERLVGRLTPRSDAAEIPGFDIAPGGTGDPVLLQEHLNTGLRVGSAQYTCSVGEPGAEAIYRIRVVVGDPVAVRLAVIDAPVPLDVGRNGGGVIVIEGIAGDNAPTLADVVDADSGTWESFGGAAS